MVETNDKYWKYIIEKAYNHGVSSLLYHNLTKIRKFEEEFGVPEERKTEGKILYNNKIK
ncbi:MAG: hypothetical protein OCU22_04435 [Canidatus Methanoxibalbensis ujae]|nr:hypothetical protein [Candidatus Methanoxibalbensis ujae]